MIATDLSSHDVLTLWQTFFIIAGICVCVIAVATAFFYGAEGKREHERSMKQLEINMASKQFELQKARNEELDLQLGLSERDRA